MKPELCEIFGAGIVSLLEFRGIKTETSITVEAYTPVLVILLEAA